MRRTRTRQTRSAAAVCAWSTSSCTNSSTGRSLSSSLTSSARTRSATTTPCRWTRESSRIYSCLWRTSRMGTTSSTGSMWVTCPHALLAPACPALLAPACPACAPCPHCRGLPCLCPFCPSCPDLPCLCRPCPSCPGLPCLCPSAHSAVCMLVRVGRFCHNAVLQFFADASSNQKTVVCRLTHFPPSLVIVG